MRTAPKYAGNIVSLVVGREKVHRPLQDFLSESLGLSRRAAKAIIDGRNVWVNRKCVWIAHHVLATGDTIEIPRAIISAAKRQKGSDTSKNAAAPVAESSTRHIRILVETPEYLVADKPAGFLSNADPSSVEALLRVQAASPNLQAVHRLDRDTSGCLLFAKSYAAYLAAVEVFKTHKVHKTYHAICAGQFPYSFTKVDAPLDGKPATTYVSREAESSVASFLRVRIETGRTNQIRRHLSSIRYPIVGDRTFGLKTARDPRLISMQRQMLHASELTLPNPLHKGEDIHAKSPLPADFRAALRALGMGRK